MQTSRSSLIKQLAVAAIGQALPQESVLSDAAADVRKGLVASLIMGILAAALILFGCFEFYTFLLSEGLDRSTVSLMTFGLLTLLIVISGFAASHYSKQAIKVKDSIAVFPQSNDLFEGVETLVAAFVRGFNSQARPSPDKHQAKESVEIGRAYVYAQPNTDDGHQPNGRLHH